MTGSDIQKTIDKMWEVLKLNFGLPKTNFLDNGRQFVSIEFKEFCKNNGIVHRTSALYHTAINGQAENMVGTFKTSFKKTLKNPINAGIETITLVQRFLASYQNTPHATTEETPSKRMFKKEGRTRLSFLSKSWAEKAANY